MPIVDALCPHRGGKTKMTTGTGKNKVLAAGELFVEYPDTGVGTGKSKIKIGDGVTAYSSLPYALGETSTDLITFSESTATSVTQALNEAVSGASLATIIGGLKKAIQLASQSGGVNIFTGTLEEWNQLTDEEKAQYDLISNDEPGGLQDMFPSSLVGYGANSNVEAELNKLNDEFHDDEYEYYGKLDTDIIDIYLDKFKSIVFCHIMNIYSLVSNQRIVIENIIPVGYRPPLNNIAFTMVRSSSIFQNVEIEPRANGNFNLYNYGSAISDVTNFYNVYCWPTIN